jgi:hypothetical protein
MTTVTIPSIAAVGDQVQVQGNGAGCFTIAQNASQVIHTGTMDTTVGVTGSLIALDRYNGLTLMCVVANTDWKISNAIGKGYTIT